MGPRRPPLPGCAGRRRGSAARARRLPGDGQARRRVARVCPAVPGTAPAGRSRQALAGAVRPSPAGRRASPGRVAGGRWSVGRAECCGPVRLGSRDPLSAGGGRRARQPRLVLGAGHRPGWGGRVAALSGAAAGGLDSHAWSWGPVIGRLGGRVAGSPGRRGPVRARVATGCFPGRTGQGRRVAGAALRCPGGASQDHRAGLPDRPLRRAWRSRARCRAPPGARRCVTLAASRGSGLLPGGCRAPGCCRLPGRAPLPGRGVARRGRRAVAAPRAFVRAAPCSFVRARNRRRKVPWCLLAGYLRRNGAVWQPGARTAARGPAVLQIRIAHGASVFLPRAPHGAVRHFS